MTEILPPLPVMPEDPPTSPLSIVEDDVPNMTSASSSDAHSNGSPKTPVHPTRSAASSPGPSSARSKGKETMQGEKLGESSTSRSDFEEEGPEYIQPAELLVPLPPATFPIIKLKYSSYPLKNYTKTSNSWSPVPQLGEGVWLTPEEDKQATRGIPIFRPTMEEFQVSNLHPTFLTSSCLMSHHFIRISKHM
jgi:hypothetical protein